jgi:predicted DNA-binding transcriptional regulator AlpA
MQNEQTQSYLKTADAAAFLGLSSRTLEKHRSHGTGPAFRKLGGRVVYAISDLHAWAALAARNSTSDPGIEAASPRRRNSE